MAGDVGKLIAPPYDVIDEQLRDTLLRLSEYNIAHVTRAERQPSAASGNPYDAAGKLWADWKAGGVVKPDEQPTVYVYEQFFELHGHKLSRTAMIARVRLESLGKGVLPHEDTLAAPREDRLMLLRATRAQFGPVFGLYPDPEERIDRLLGEAKTQRPLTQAVDSDGLLHRLWGLTDSAAVTEIHEAMLPKELLLADGHHRYETALAYRDEHPECEAAQFRLMALVNMSNTGLVVLPTHRLIKALRDFSAAEFLGRLKRAFDVRVYPGGGHVVCRAACEAIRSHQARGRNAFCLFLGDGNHYVLVLRRPDMMDRAQDRSEAWRRLDVSILQRLILRELLGITRERLQNQANVEYIQDFPHALDEAHRRVEHGKAQALFQLNPTRVEDVQAVVHNHERMPQKSTFFYPKVYSGLVFYSVED